MTSLNQLSTALWPRVVDCVHHRLYGYSIAYRACDAHLRRHFQEARATTAGAVRALTEERRAGGQPRLLQSFLGAPGDAPATLASGRPGTGDETFNLKWFPSGAGPVDMAIRVPVGRGRGPVGAF